MFRKFLSSLFDLGPVLPIADAKPERVPASWVWPHWPGGTMKFSRRLETAILYRYQPKAFQRPAEEWHKLFVDREHKWQAKNRFSGNGVVPGHYFALSRVGAQAEIDAYDAQVSDFDLMLLQVSIDNVLDLTNPTNLTKYYSICTNDPEEWHPAIVLDEFLYQRRGGNVSNSRAAHCAVQDGYTGIIYCGARSASTHWHSPGEFEHNLNLAGLSMADLASDPNCINVVLFFGHNVVRYTHAFSYQKKRTENVHFQKSYEELDELFMADPERPSGTDLTYAALRERCDRVHWQGEPD